MRSMGSMAAAVNRGMVPPTFVTLLTYKKGKMFGGETGRAKSPS